MKIGRVNGVTDEQVDNPYNFETIVDKVLLPAIVPKKQRLRMTKLLENNHKMKNDRSLFYKELETQAIKDDEDHKLENGIEKRGNEEYKKKIPE